MYTALRSTEICNESKALSSRTRKLNHGDTRVIEQLADKAINSATLTAQYVSKIATLRFYCGFYECIMI